MLAALRDDPLTRDIPVVGVCGDGLTSDEQTRLARQVMVLRQADAYSEQDLRQDVRRALAAVRR
jgi:hypothetical protein